MTLQKQRYYVQIRYVKGTYISPCNKPLKNEDSRQTSSSNLYSRRIAYSDDAQPQSGGMQYLGDINSMVPLIVGT